MPRPLRLEYSGAIYHMMNRGDRREPIFNDDFDRKRFVVTLTEVCNQTGWQVHADCLMNNHFHLVVETPGANLVGEQIGNSTHNPSGNYYANPAIYAPYNVSLSNVRVRYAAQAFYTGGSYYGNTLTLSDSQVTDSGVMAALGCGYGWDGPITLTCNNCLYSGGNNGGVAVLDYGSYGNNYVLNHCTIDANCVVYGSNNYGSGNAVNSIFANAYSTGNGSWQGSHNGFYNCYYYATFGNPQFSAQASPPFKSWASDNYYLAVNPGGSDASGFRDAGTTTGVDPALLADLQTTTTYTPTDGYRADTGAPDLGYHYPIVNTDSDGDGLPDWWELYWFGNLTHAGSNVDANGNTLQTDYQYFANGLAFYDPNVISFSLFTTNNYASGNIAHAQVIVLGGWPSHQAILVNNTNFAGATWTSYNSTNLTVNLGSRPDGDYAVWVGLRGWPTNATPTWQEIHFTIDTKPPVLVITNPATTTVGVPLVQLQGYAKEQLSAFTFDVSNATGVVTGQQGIIMSQDFNTNTWKFTTNHFQCYDVTLTPGTNLVILHATDFAGNTTNCNLLLNLDLTTRVNPPVVQLTWPQDGMKVSGTSFTLDGFVDDPTATIAAQIVDASGNTNSATGVAERNGRFWVDNLPLSGGNNQLILTVTDAAGHAWTTNINVIQSAVALAITLPTDLNQLWQSAVTVSGTFSGSGYYTVSVNGQTTNVSGSSWSVINVPVTTGGVACFTAAATQGGQTQANAKSSPPKPDTIGLIVWHDDQTMHQYDDGLTKRWWPDLSRFDWTNELWETQDGSQHWDFGYGGTNDSTVTVDDVSGYWDYHTDSWLASENSPSHSSVANDWQFPPLDTVPPNPYDYLNSVNTGTGGDTGLNNYLGCEVCDVQNNYDTHPWDLHVNYWENLNFWEYINHHTYTRHAHTAMALLSGGRAIPGRQILHEISGWVKHIPPPYTGGPPPYHDYFFPTGGYPTYTWFHDLPTVPNSSVHLLGNTLHDDPNYPGSGSLYYVTPAGADPIRFTPNVYGDQHYVFGVNDSGPGGNDTPSFSDAPHVLNILANSKPLNSQPIPDFCVGQFISFVLDGLPSYVGATAFYWTFGGHCFNNSTPSVPESSDCSLTYFLDDSLLAIQSLAPLWWVSGGPNAYTPAAYNASVQCTLNFPNSQSPIRLSASGLFNMYRPTAKISPSWSAVGVYDNSVLKFGTATQAGIKFNHTVTYSPNFSGTVDWIQVDRNPSRELDSTVEHILIYATPGPYLDGEAQYGTFEGNDPVDSPRLPLPFGTSYSKGIASDKFTMTMMFSPPGGGMKVPLRAVDWSWNGTATNSPSAWGIQSGSGAPDGSDYRVEDYPQWDGNVADGFWDPELTP